MTPGRRLARVSEVTDEAITRLARAREPFVVLSAQDLEVVRAEIRALDAAIAEARRQRLRKH